jgi:hypothetical protein
VPARNTLFAYVCEAAPRRPGLVGKVGIVSMVKHRRNAMMPWACLFQQRSPGSRAICITGTATLGLATVSQKLKSATLGSLLIPVTPSSHLLGQSWQHETCAVCQVSHDSKARQKNMPSTSYLACMDGGGRCRSPRGPDTTRSVP